MVCLRKKTINRIRDPFQPGDEVGHRQVPQELEADVLVNRVELPPDFLLDVLRSLQHAIDDEHTFGRWQQLQREPERLAYRQRSLQSGDVVLARIDSGHRRHGDDGGLAEHVAVLPGEGDRGIRHGDHDVDSAPGVLLAQVVRDQPGLRGSRESIRLNRLDVDFDRPGARGAQRLLDRRIEGRSEGDLLAVVVQHEHARHGRRRGRVQRGGSEDCQAPQPGNDDAATVHPSHRLLVARHSHS